MEKLKPDVVFKNFWRDNAQFVSLFNTVVFQGKEVIHPENLRERNFYQALGKQIGCIPFISIVIYYDETPWQENARAIFSKHWPAFQVFLYKDCCLFSGIQRGV